MTYQIYSMISVVTTNLGKEGRTVVSGSGSFKEAAESVSYQAAYSPIETRM